MNSAADLGKAPVSSLVLRLAIPAMIAQFVNVLYSIIDRMYIGHIPAIGRTPWPAWACADRLSPCFLLSELWWASAVLSSLASGWEKKTFPKPDRFCPTPSSCLPVSPWF